MEKTVFSYSGEGTHGPETGSGIFKTSRKWNEINELLNKHFNLDLERLWNENVGSHVCPFSPMRTFVSQVCLADIWSQWGYTPDIVIGHSTGELAAAYQAGFYSIEEILSIVNDIGLAAAELDGRMAHGWLTDLKEDDYYVSSANFKHKRGIHVTVSGAPDQMAEFLLNHPDFSPMPIPHPWHHPSYKTHTSRIKPQASASIDSGRFVSGLTGKFETRLSNTHWQNWMMRPIDFVAAVDTLNRETPDTRLIVIEIGAHPVLAQSSRALDDAIHVPSLCRGEPDLSFMSAQRRKLAGVIQ